MSASEQQLEQGRAIQELTKSEGWSLLRDRIREEIQQAQEDQANIDGGGDPVTVGTEFIRLDRLIAGLKRTEEIVTEMLEQYDRDLNEA